MVPIAPLTETVANPVSREATGSVDDQAARGGTSTPRCMASFRKPASSRFRSEAVV